MKRFAAIASSVILASTCAFAAGPGWQHGVVREVDNNYAHIAVTDHDGTPGLRGHGPVTQICTVQVGSQLVTGERPVHETFGRAGFDPSEDSTVSLRIAGKTMIVKDGDGNSKAFRVVHTEADSPANRPDRTAFSRPPLVIQ